MPGAACLLVHATSLAGTRLLEAPLQASSPLAGLFNLGRSQWPGPPTLTPDHIPLQRASFSRALSRSLWRCEGPEQNKTAWCLSLLRHLPLFPSRRQLFRDLEILNFTSGFRESSQSLAQEARRVVGGATVRWWLGSFGSISDPPLAYRDRDPFLGPFAARQIG